MDDGERPLSLSEQLYLPSSVRLTSFVPKSLIKGIVTSSSVTYESIRKRLQRKHIPIRLMELRNHLASFMVRHRLIREEVDLLQGRIPGNVFIRHYWTPSFKELRSRTLKAVSLLQHSYV